MPASLKLAKPDSPRAWLMAATAFVASFTVFGITYSFGAFFNSMAAEFHAGHAATSLFFAITGFATYMLASVAGHLSDRFGPRIVVATGALTIGAGLVLTAFIDHLWIGYLTYGVGVGVGAACAYLPTLAIVGGWFVKRRNTALGIAAAGTGCGTLLIPTVAAALIGRYGWRTTDILFGLGAAILLGACAIAAEPPPLSAAPERSYTIRALVSSPDFVKLYISWLLATTALFVPLVFLPSYARDQGATEVAAAALLSLIGGVSIAGRLGLGTLGARFGILKPFKVSVLTMAVSYAIWLIAPSYGWLLVFAILLGFSYGVRISIMPAVLIEFFGRQNLGALLGVFFTSSGISAILGPPLAGIVIDYTGSYRWGIAFALAMGLLGFAAIVRLRESAHSENQLTALAD